jgi:hypothetical protein
LIRLELRQRRFFPGRFNPTARTSRWREFAPTGGLRDLPQTCRLSGINAINGDMNTHGSLYASSGLTGFAWYNPD